MPLARVSNRRLASVVAGGLIVAAAALGMPAPAGAQDAPDVPVDRKIIDRIMTGLGFQRPGGGPNINYAERSPLVIPPSRDLPPPEANTAETNPAWPDDPDLKRRKEAAQQRWRMPLQGYGGFAEEDSRVLSRSELERGRVTRTNRPNTSNASPGDNLGSDPAVNRETFSLRKIFGSSKEESAKFTGEPTRGALTQPPSGYQTPSPHHPYGVSPTSNTAKPVMEDRAARDVR